MMRPISCLLTLVALAVVHDRAGAQGFTSLGCSPDKKDQFGWLVTWQVSTRVPEPGVGSGCVNWLASLSAVVEPTPSGAFVVTFHGQHLLGPHAGTDVDPNPNSVDMIVRSPNLLGTTDANKWFNVVLAAPNIDNPRVISHPTSGGPHVNEFRLMYNRARGQAPGTEEVKFWFAGRHCEVLPCEPPPPPNFVPEPGPLSLLASGVLGIGAVGVALRRRHRA